MTVRVAPALGHEISVPAQQVGWLDEEVPETVTGEQPSQVGQHPVGRLGRRPVDLASQERHFVAQDLDREVFALRGMSRTNWRTRQNSW
jgi:hypothetical protein